MIGRQQRDFSLKVIQHDRDLDFAGFDPNSTHVLATHDFIIVQVLDYSRQRHRDTSLIGVLSAVHTTGAY